MRTTRMESPTQHSHVTLNRDGLTTIETKRWLMDSLSEERDIDPLPETQSERVASD